MSCPKAVSSWVNMPSKATSNIWPADILGVSCPVPSMLRGWMSSEYWACSILSRSCTHQKCCRCSQLSQCSVLKLHHFTWWCGGSGCAHRGPSLWWPADCPPSLAGQDHQSSARLAAPALPTWIQGWALLLSYSAELLERWSDGSWNSVPTMKEKVHQRFLVQNGTRPQLSMQRIAS